MDAQTPAENPQPLSIILEVIPDDPNEAATAETYAIGRDTADALRNEGYIVQPVYTGRRGGFLVDVVFPLLTMMWAQKEVILADLSELIAILTPAVVVVRHLRAAHEQRVGKDAARQHPLKITVEIGGATVSLESFNQEDDVRAEQLARQLLTAHPHLQLTPQTRPKVTSRVPKTQERKRR
jgi:hypothetical protein